MQNNHDAFLKKLENRLDKLDYLSDHQKNLSVLIIGETIQNIFLSGIFVIIAKQLLTWPEWIIFCLSLGVLCILVALTEAKALPNHIIKTLFWCTTIIFTFSITYKELRKYTAPNYFNLAYHIIHGAC